MIKKAFTLVELLIAMGVLTVMTLAMADFSFDTFKMASQHSELLDDASQTRFLGDEITSKIIRAAYVFPPGITLSISGQGLSTSIETTGTLAMLLPDDNKSQYYYLECFYIQNNQLNEFVSSSSKLWAKNTQPYTTFNSNSGVSNPIATKISSAGSSIAYTLNYENSTSESIFKGQMSNASINDSLALIKGVKWTISRDGNLITIGGVSKNVPRFID